MNTFGTIFWREVNEQYYTQPLQLPCEENTRFSQRFCSLVIQILKPYLDRLDYQSRKNVLKRFEIYLIEREVSPDEVHSVLDQILDVLQMRETQSRLSLIEVSDIHKESRELLELQQSFEDPITVLLRECEMQLSDRSPIPDFKQESLYEYSVGLTSDTNVIITRSRNNFEIEAVKWAILDAENHQLADSYSISRVEGTLKIKLDDAVYLLFEKAIAEDSVKITLEEFRSLERFREHPDPVDYTITSEMEMCHFCRIMMNKSEMKQCEYDHRKNHLHEFSDTITEAQRFKYNDTEFLEDLYSANYRIYNQVISCERYFCNHCLVHELEFATETTPWICPLCLGRCSCTRCIRNDLIYKLKRQFLEIGGQLKHLQHSLLEQIVLPKKALIRQIELKRIPIELEIEKTLPIKKTYSRKHTGHQKHRLHKLSRLDSPIHLKKHKDFISLVDHHSDS